MFGHKLGYVEGRFDVVSPEEAYAYSEATYEYNAAIQMALEAYTIDIAEGMTRYGVHNGFDAWRRLYSHYMPLADDLQQLLNNLSRI